jgi:hypothetical protein
MRENPNFSAMTKADIADWAEAQGQRLNANAMTKDQMIAEAEAMAASTDQALAADPAEKPSQRSAPEGTTRIIITASQNSHEHPVSLNGRKLVLPVGKPTVVPNAYLPILDQAADVTYEEVR